MGVPVGVRVEASAVDLCEVRDECAECGAERRASVLVLARGEASAPVFLFQGRARQEAADNAELAIPVVAVVLPRVARCPCCGLRDRSVWRSRRVSHALRWAWRGPSIAILLMLPVVFAIVWLKLVVPLAALAAGAVACWIGVIVVATSRAEKADAAAADRRVEWTHVRERGEKKWTQLSGPPDKKVKRRTRTA